MTLTRRSFLCTISGSLAALTLGASAKERVRASEIAITMDDPKPDMLAGVSGSDINRRILNTLHEARLQAALFVTGMRIDNPAGKALIDEWDAAAHEICNHTYLHRSYCSPEVSYEQFSGDVTKNEPLIAGRRHFRRRFRFPFLKEGDTAEKRDRFRAFLHDHGYRIGHVTVDTSDWYIDQRIRARLEKHPNADTTPYRDYYVQHMRDRAAYYRQLAWDVLGHDIRHTILMHHNLLNALYLGAMIAALRKDNWEWVDASHAFRDPVFSRQPNIVPAGESLVWGLAKESGRFEDRLRYPGEDGEYEKAKMDALGL